jgi:UDPglucose 6-dehydrogenase
MKSISVIGQGFVGGSLCTVMAERGFEVYVYDKAGKVAEGGIPLIERDSKRLEMAGVPNVEQLPGEDTPVQQFVKECELQTNFSKVYFVCLPTPMFEDGEADLSIVERVLNELASIPGERVAVVKSTVPPGSTEKWNKLFEKTGLRVVFSPEFLTEANALDDMRNQDRIVLGGPRPWINTVKQVFETAFPNVPIVKTSSSTAEMVKYVTNIHLAVKVALANEFYQICNALDAAGANIDYDKVIEYATLDQRLGKSHWKVPGPMPADDTGLPALGFSGSCFVKDLNALMSIAKTLGVDPKVMAGAWQKNLEVRPQRDWEKLVGRAVSKKS